MLITSVRLETVRWPIASAGAARGRSERAAIIVELTTADGVVGLGEAAPLPEYTFDSLAAAQRDLEVFAASTPFECAPTLAAASAIAARASTPSARFAIETALLAAAATIEESTVAALLVDDPAEEMPCAVVVDTPAQAEAAIDAGAECLKIKVGLSIDRQRVIDILKADDGAIVSYRFDANRAWPRDGIREILAQYTGAALLDSPPHRDPITDSVAAFGYAPRHGDDYEILVEEPCPDMHTITEPLPLPIALDESLATMTDAEIDRALLSTNIVALMLKPTLLGGFARCLDLAKRARAANKACIVTHALEGPIGTAACAELALAINGASPVGLAPHAALAGWPIAPGQLEQTLIKRSDAPGLGLVGRTHPTPEHEGLSISAWPHLAFEPAVLSSSTSGSNEHAEGDEGTADNGEWSFADLAISAALEPRPVVGRPAHTLVAIPTVDTIRAIYAALDTSRPIALLHPRLPGVELGRQRAAVEAATLPPDAAVILFTSGSTGAARGVVLSRDALAAAADAAKQHLDYRDDDRWLLALPLAHAGGLAIVIRCLSVRLPLVLLDGDFDRATCAAALERCTLASLVPTQLAALLDDPAWRPPPKLRAVLLGGAAPNPSLLEHAAERGVPFLTSYGLTETFGQIATAPLSRAGDPHAALVPLAGVDVHAGTRDAPAPIRIRAPMLATCYLDGTPIAPELTTADLGFLDAGALHIIGRADRVIITGGENVQPTSVEAVLAATPGVRAACVFGVSDPRWGQLVAAAIAVDQAFDVAAATADWRTALASHALPRELAVVRDLPLLPNGKVDYAAAAQLARVRLTY